MAAIDLARVRHDTPGVAHVTHFNNAGASLPTRQALDAQTDHLWLEARVGGYEAAAIRADPTSVTTARDSASRSR